MGNHGQQQSSKASIEHITQSERAYLAMTQWHYLLLSKPHLLVSSSSWCWAGGLCQPKEASIKSGVYTETIAVAPGSCAQVPVAWPLGLLFPGATCV